MNESLWLDEATTALVSKMSLHDIFFKFLPGDFHPPLYYLLMKYWVNIFGNSEFSLRIPSLIFALLTIYVIYKTFGKISAILLASAPLLFYYAQEARMYTMAMFLVACLISCFLKIIKKGSWADYFVFSVILFLVFLTDYVALLIIPVLWLSALIMKKKPGWLVKFVLSHSLLIISGVFWFPFLQKQLVNGLSVAAVAPTWSELLGRTSLKNLALIPVKFMVGRVGFDNKWSYGLVIAFVGSLFGYLLFRSIRPIRLIRNLRVIWLWLTVPLVLAAVLSFRVSILTYFRFLFVLPAFYILIAEGIKKLGKYSKLIISLVLLINLALIGYYLASPKFHREDWRGAVKTIGGDQIILPANSQTEALAYYGKAGQVVTNPTGKTIWLSRYVTEVFDPEDSVRKKVDSLGYMKNAEYNFNGVVFWRYTKQ